ncbi:MAG: SDR family oxidoreductase [Pyrinomonadaceae bacterium]|nr:SDR family oxidoreductase [Pyrinomonadaceae bacterium]
MILVMGASGNIGKEVVKGLSARGAQFRAAFRSAEQAIEAGKNGTKAVILDYAKPETLEATLLGVEKVFFVTSPLPNLAELEGNVVDATQRAGIKHLVKLSVCGAPGEDFKFSLPHRAVEKKIEASGIPYTFLRPNGFMQNMLANAPTIKGQGAFYLPFDDARVSQIDVRDIGAVAATVLTEEGHEGKAYELSGPEAHSNAERAEILSEVLGKTVTYVSPPDAEWKAMAMSFGMPEWQVDGIIDLAQYYKAGKAERVSPRVKEVTGQEPIPYRRFVEDHAQAFR